MVFKKILHLTLWMYLSVCEWAQNKNQSICLIFFNAFIRNFEHLIPDAPELIHDFLVNEKDASCKRNAFMMLIHADQVCNLTIVVEIVHWMQERMSWNLSICFFDTCLQDRALDYLSTCIDQVHTFGDILQLVIVELIYKVSFTDIMVANTLQQQFCKEINCIIITSLLSQVAIM